MRRRQQVNYVNLFRVFGVDVQQHLQGIRNQADADEKLEAAKKVAKKRYRELCLEHHPDRTGGNDTKIKELNQMWDYLKQARLMYRPPQLQRGITITYTPSSTTTGTTTGSSVTYTVHVNPFTV